MFKMNFSFICIMRLSNFVQVSYHIIIFHQATDFEIEQITSNVTARLHLHGRHFEDSFDARGEGRVRGAGINSVTMSLCNGDVF
mmetsp:Transcript_28345/g.39549  ORF Transcript_28345/g.39549 Transcript_28345/m.39549 type:complete len:84 (-) Transcript_28345:1049-1300(-)